MFLKNYVGKIHHTTVLCAECIVSEVVRVYILSLLESRLIWPPLPKSLDNTALPNVGILEIRVENDTAAGLIQLSFCQIPPRIPELQKTIIEK